MEKKKKTRFIVGWLLITAALLAGSLLVPGHGKSESVQEAMRDAVLHGTNRISLFGLKDVNVDVLPLGPMLVGILVSFVVAYASIAWLLRFVASNSLRAFVYYRIVLGVALIALLATGTMTAT